MSLPPQQPALRPDPNMSISLCGMCGQTCYFVDSTWIYECTCNNFDFNLQGPQQSNYVTPSFPQMPQTPQHQQRWQIPQIPKTPQHQQRWQMPQIPKTPQTPQRSQTPQTPATPQMSQHNMTYHIPHTLQHEFAKQTSVRDMFASGYGQPQTAYGAGPSQPHLQDPSILFNSPALTRTAPQAVGSHGPSTVSQLAAVESQKIWDAQGNALHAQLSHEARNVPAKMLGKNRMICCLCHRESPIRPAKNDGIHCTTCFNRRLSSGQQLLTLQRQREHNTKQAAIAAAKQRKEALINGNPTAAQCLAPYEPANKRVKLSPSMPSQSQPTQASQWCFNTSLQPAELLSTNGAFFGQMLLPAEPTSTNTAFHGQTLPNTAFHGQFLPSAESFNTNSTYQGQIPPSAELNMNSIFQRQTLPPAELFSTNTGFYGQPLPKTGFYGQTIPPAELFTTTTAFYGQRLSNNGFHGQTLPQAPAAISAQHSFSAPSSHQSSSAGSSLVEPLRNHTTPKIPTSISHKRSYSKNQEFVGRGSTASPTPAPKPLKIQEALKRARPISKVAIHARHTAIRTPAVSTPALSTPALSTPAFSTPALSLPALGTSALGTPEAVVPAPNTATIASDTIATAPDAFLTMSEAVVAISDTVELGMYPEHPETRLRRESREQESREAEDDDEEFERILRQALEEMD